MICLDDVDALQDSQTWQIAVFDLLNRVKELGISHVVACANGGPMSLNLQLADLASRLAWGVSFTLASLSDEGALRGIINPGEAKRASNARKSGSVLG
ncbi:hypothetical protein P4S73_05120 [Paraglaciecola sp. Hal342]